MKFIWIGQVRPQNSLLIGIHDRELPHITELVQDIRKRYPARAAPTPFDIRDCVRAFFGCDELRHRGQVRVDSEKRAQVIRRAVSFEDNSVHTLLRNWVRDTTPQKLERLPVFAPEMSVILNRRTQKKYNAACGWWGFESSSIPDDHIAVMPYGAIYGTMQSEACIYPMEDGYFYDGGVGCVFCTFEAVLYHVEDFV